jgi:alkaline phosphatase D
VRPVAPDHPALRHCALPLPLRIARRVPALACIALAAWLTASAAAAKLVVMHGPAELTSATLWIQTDVPTAVTVSWRAEGEADERTQELAATDANERIVLARLTGLTPGATAAYRVRAGAEQHEGTVRAQPYWTRAAEAGELTFALGSCFFLADADPRWPGQDYGGGYEIFDAIAAKKPDLMLWLGDNLYLQQPDFFDPASMAARYRRQRAFAPLQQLLTATTHLAIWDDHDYGPNDSDASYVLKGETLKLFGRYWPNPGFGLPDTPGTFGAARYGDVLFFLLDDRYYRSPNRWPDGPDKTMFGARQLEWLKQALVSAPRASIKIVAGGSQLWKRAGRFEGWHHFGTERRAFADWLVAQKIEGVVFLSGDRHFSELLKVERPGAYPLYEFTSSPLTSRTPGRLDAADRDNPDAVPGTQVVKRQFGLIRVSGPGADRQLAFESYDSSGALLWRHEVRAKDLRFPATWSPRP